MPKTRTSGQGRPKGAIGKVNATIKEMIVGALSDVGGRAYLARQANENPTAFMSLLGRVLPLQVTGEGGGALAIDFRWADAAPAAAPVAETIEAVAVAASDANDGDDEILFTFAAPRIEHD